jgi:predicted nucleic acid-binding protein
VTRRLAVFDASVLLRAVLVRNEEARGWTTRAQRGEVVALVPDLVWAEVTNVLAYQVRAGAISRGSASRALDRLLALPLETHGTRSTAAGALAAAMSLGLSGYDAFYLVLADAAGAILVTADRKLARAATRVELLA